MNCLFNYLKIPSTNFITLIGKKVIIKTHDNTQWKIHKVWVS